MVFRAQLIVVVFALTTAAQTPSHPLTIQDCLRLAETARNAVTMARQEREIADRDLIQARAGLLPQTHIQNGFTYNSPNLNDRSTFSFIPLNGIREYGVLGTITQEFDTSGRIRAEMQRARANQDVARVNLDITLRDLRRSVAIAYYRLLLTRHLVGVIDETLKESRSFEQRARLLYEKGEAARADLVKASAQVAFLQQAFAAAELEASIANQELCSFWTKDVTEPLEISDMLAESPPPPEIEPAAVNVAPYLKRSEFNLLDAQQRGFKADAQFARSALLPQFGFVFQYGIDSTGLRWRDRGYAGYFNLRIPIFDWFRARSQTQQFRLRAEQIETSRAITERDFSRDYQNARARVQRLFEQIALTREQVRLSEEDLSLSRLRYEAGEGAALDVVTAQTQLAQARNNYYTSLANYLSARIDLEVTSGK